MLNKPVFRLTFLAAFYAFSIDALSMEKGELGDTNPFLEIQPDSHIEPSGVVIYDFNSSKNSVTSLDSSQAHINESRETAIKGFSLVESHRIRDFDQLVKGYKDANAELLSKFASERQVAPPEKIPQEVAFKRRNLVSFESKDIAKILDIPRGDYYSNKGWDASVRAYKNENEIFIISEWDYSISNGGVIMDERAVNTHVQNFPGILTVRIDDRGRAETVLFWADNERAYTIESNQNLGTSDGRKLLRQITLELTKGS